VQAGADQQQIAKTLLSRDEALFTIGAHERMQLKPCERQISLKAIARRI